MQIGRSWLGGRCIISSPSLTRFPILAALGIPEIWRFYNDRLFVYLLADGRYTEAEASAFLPGVTPADITRLVQVREQMAPNAWQRMLGDYARQIETRG